MEQDDGRANRVEPQTLAFLQAVAEGGAPLQILAPAAARSRLAAIQRNVQITKAPVVIEERVINAGPTGQFKLWLVRPSGNTGSSPSPINSSEMRSEEAPIARMAPISRVRSSTLSGMA